MTYVVPGPSSVPAVLQYLQTQIMVYLKQVADPFVNTIGVYIGEEPRRRPDDIILIDHEVRRALRPATLIGGGGKGYMFETYQIETLISCYRGDPDPIAIQNRAYTLLAYVEDVIRQDMTLGGTVNVQGKPTETRGGTPVWTETTPQGRLCEIVLTIEVENRL